MIIILLGLLFTVNAQWWGSRPQGRNHEVFTGIYLDPAERYVTGSRFESSEDRGAEGADCNCQGICGYGRGSSGHLIFGNNKKSGARGCHWCGHGQYDPSYGDHDKIVYCYNHVCDPGYVSICEQSKHFSIWAESYHPTHRACTCAKAAGQWTQVPGNYADEEVTTSTTQYEEYAHSVTNTNTVAIETSATYGVEIEGIGASSTLTMTEEFSDAVENSWTTGSSTTKEISLKCGNDNKDTAWQYVIYMYDVLCASGDASKRFLAKANGGCAISAFLSGSGTTCTTSASEPPCCGPGANPIGTNDRKFCEDDYESWTGQCDGWSSRVRFTSIEDGRINCHINECPDETDRSLQAHLSTCGQTCANNGYANTFVPSHVFDAPNMLRCKDLGWATEWFQKSYCKQIASTKHVVALMRRDCAYLVYSTSVVEFDDAYKSAEEYATSGGEDALDLVPIYYNNWQGVCDGHMNIGQEVENCKCDDECHKWGDCCNTCAEANSYAVESMTEREWQHLGPLRSSLTEEEFKMERDAFENACYTDKTLTHEVDSRCMAPDGESWYRMPADWHSGVCDDSTCVYRCRENGIAFNSDYGASYGVGDLVSCVRGRKKEEGDHGECPYTFHQYDCPGNNIISYDTSVAQCEILCNNDPTCKGFSYKDDRCITKSASCITTVSNGWSFYAKEECSSVEDSHSYAKGGYILGALGEVCETDLLIRTEAECESAMQALGLFNPTISWSNSDSRIPAFCSYRPDASYCNQYSCANEPHMGHFNTDETNTGREDLQPVCIDPNDVSGPKEQTLIDCKTWARNTKEDNGCTCYHQGFDIISSTVYHDGGLTTRAYASCDKNECYAFCDELYAGSTINSAGFCKDGCDKYEERGGCNAHNICPSGFDAISNNLDGEGKKWASDKSSRTVQECANICKDRYGCTGFEYNEKNGGCGTYTGGSINVQQDEGRLYAASEWRSCLAANGRRRKL